MPDDRSSFEREDALVCADVLGGFGVASDHVEALVDPDGDLEVALQDALAAASQPTAFVRDAIAASPRGVDAPAEFWTTAPETQLGDVFASLDWTFDVRSANGRSLAIDDAQPYRLRVEDADGRTRTTDFSFPDTPFGDDNYPALVHAVNDDLLFGLDCRIVQLADGTDRWRFALVETDELDRLRDQFGDDVSVFGEPLLAPDQPDAYVPDDSAGVAGPLDVPIPDWAADGEDDASSGTGWRDRELTASSFDADHVGGLDHLSTPDDAEGASADDAAPSASSGDSSASGASQEDASASGASEAGSSASGASEAGSSASGASEAGSSASGASEAGSSASGASEAGSSTTDPSPIEFVDDDASGGEPAGSGSEAGAEAGAAGSRSVSDSASTLGGSLEPVDRVEIRDADVEADRASDGDTDDLDGWSIGGTVDATTRSSESTSTADAAVPGSTSETADALELDTGGGVDAAETADGGSPNATASPEAASASPTTTTAKSKSGSQIAGSAEVAEDADEHSSEDRERAEADDEDDGFFSADAVSSFDAGAKTQRVEPDSFGVDAAEQTEDDQFAAVGAAISAPARISVGGLLDDDEFLPEIPRAEPAQVRIEFEDEFDPSAPAEREERETEGGFVWVNESGGLAEKRSSATD